MVTIYTEEKKNNITWKTLYRADRAIKVPLQITLEDDNTSLCCEQIMRLVPQKRLLAFGRFGDKEVAVKCFYEKNRAQQDAERDAFGVESLMQANVPTPKLLYKGSIDKGRIHLLVFEKINQGVNLGTLWQNRKHFIAMEELLHAVIIELATQHVLGILQKDLHLNNFFVTRRNIYTLDGGKIECFDRPLDKPTSIEYLALFLVQLGVGQEHLQRKLFDSYTKSRGWIVKPADIKMFEDFFAALAKERMRKYKKKIFRRCSAFNRIDKINKSIVYDRQYESETFNKFLQHPDLFVDSPAATLLKNGRSSTVVKIEIDGRILVIKRYNIKNAWHGLQRCFKESRAHKSWRISQQLYAVGVTTPKPVAFIDQHVLGLRGTSYLVMEYLKGENLGEYIKQHPEASETIAINTLKLFKNLTKLCITQGDLKITNILVHEDLPYLIDFDGAKEHLFSITLKRSFKHELQRFMQNWEKSSPIFALFARLIRDEEMV